MSQDRPGEFSLIARYFAPLAAPGGLNLTDDAAMLAPPAGCDLVLTKDCLVAGVHFFPDDPPADIARKALRVNLSDLAAKGATPLGFLLGLGLPDDWQESWVAAFARGLGEDAARYHCPLYGGDTVRSPDRLILSVTAFGAVPEGRMLRRSGGQAGDTLYVTGPIGGAAIGLALRLNRAVAGLADLTDAAQAAADIAYRLPDPANGLGSVLRDHASAAMDVSDGLVGDAAKLASASGCGLIIDTRLVPFPAGIAAVASRHPALVELCITGGDDYQVLAAIPPARAAAFERKAEQAGRGVTRIGSLTAAGTRIIGRDGRELTLTRGSFSHF